MPGREQTRLSIPFSAPVCPMTCSNKTLCSFGLQRSSVDCKVRVRSPDNFLVLEMLSVVILFISILQ